MQFLEVVEFYSKFKIKERWKIIWTNYYFLRERHVAHGDNNELIFFLSWKFKNTPELEKRLSENPYLRWIESFLYTNMQN